MILVTGGSGLVGSHLLFELTRTGKKVRALKRENSNLFWVREIFSYYDSLNSSEFFNQIEWIECGLDDIGGLMSAMEGVSTVYHCAAMVSFNPSEKKKMLSVNIDGTANLINACLNSGVKRFCHCSSVSSLGQSEEGKIIDEDNVWKTSKNNSWYAISKFGAEREVWRGGQEGLNIVIVNPSIIVGPGDISRSSSKIFETIVKGLKYYSNGKTGFVDVRDVARAMVTLAETEIKSERFILNSQNLSYKEYFEILARHAEVKPPKIKAGPFFLGLAWRLDKLRSIITRKPPLITKETASSALKVISYSNRKIEETLNFKFITTDDAAKNLSEFHGKKKPKTSIAKSIFLQKK